VLSEDYPWLQALTTPPLFTQSSRRLAQEGVPPREADRAVKAIERALAAEGPLTRAALGERIAAQRVRTEGQALVHILMRACLQGLVVRGPMAGRQHAYALVRDWIGESKPVERDAALAELARRYLAGHGPATDRDLAKWAGLPLGQVRVGLHAIAPELNERADGRVDLRRRPRAAPIPAPRLLGPYDPLLLGWVSREPILGARQDTVVANGLFRPIALVKGSAVATWRMAAGEVALEPFARLTRADRTALDADAADVVRFLGG
jgi:hypothetical protein